MLKEVAGVPQMHIAGTVDKVSKLVRDSADTLLVGTRSRPF